MWRRDGVPMSRELLEQVAATLTAAGFRTGEEYPPKFTPSSLALRYTSRAEVPK